MQSDEMHGASKTVSEDNVLVLDRLWSCMAPCLFEADYNQRQNVANRLLEQNLDPPSETIVQSLLHGQ